MTTAISQTPLRRSNDELRALAERGARELGDAPADAVVAWVARNFDTSLATVACSMADAILPHLVSQYLPDIDVLFLDTGYHFPETYETRDRVARELSVRVVNVQPRRTVAEQDVDHGKDLFARDPNLCCALRKVEPLGRSLENYELWFTGVRRDEAVTRTATPVIAWDAKNGLIKVSPLAAWTFDQTLDYASAFSVPVNPLTADGYPSIGCAPCTSRVAPGDDPRSGRWAGFGKTECGLHE
ncbi:phosphoadenylyl-sulfate reductase [Diaminobutyricibacter sp. McL0608]|uniref:phosphoadenylyl-sulfate reductase n=1 Tax=Leifsonia sp. McL0608 TaxID=3143537 RepID=UPI0031F2F542